MRPAIRQHATPPPNEQSLAASILYAAAFTDLVPALEALTNAAREEHESGSDLGTLLGWVSIDSPRNVKVTLAPRTYWRQLSRLAGVMRLREKPWQHQDAADVLRLVFITPHEQATSTITLAEIQESVS